MVHRSIVATSRLLKEHFKSEDEVTLSLPHIAASAFRIYTTWLSTKKICTDLGEMEHAQEASATLDHAEFNSLSGCLQLGHDIGDDHFHNASVDAIIDIAVEHGCYPVQEVKHLRKDLPKASPVLKLLVDFWVYRGKFGRADWDDALDSCSSVDHMRDVVRGLARKEGDVKDEDLPWLKDRCRYHIHTESGAECKDT